MQFFDEESVRRIVRSVLRTEKLPFNNPSTVQIPIQHERFRLIRGQSVGNQNTNTILLDNIKVLAGGFDPSGGNPTAQIPVNNLVFIPGYSPRAFVDDQWVDAIYNQTGTGDIYWETVEVGTGASGSENYRLIQGLPIDDYYSTDSTVNISGVEPLSSGLDPVEGNPTTIITVAQSQQEEFHTNTPIVAIRNEGVGTGEDVWRTLAVERNRLICGDYYGFFGSETDIIVLRNIDVLSSGLDPRSSPGSADAQILVWVAHPAFFGAFLGQRLYAAYNYHVASTSGGNPVDWELLPSGSGGAGTGTINIVKGYTTAQVDANATEFQITGLTLISGELPSSPLDVEQSFPVGYANGQYLMAIQSNTGTWVNMPDAGKVRTSNLDMLPEYLYDSLINQAVYYSGSHQPVYAQEENVAGNNYRLRLFTDRGTGTGNVGTGGYCIAYTGTKFDHDAITTNAGERAVDIDTNNQQFWVHFGDAARAQDAKWKTGSGYHSSSGTAQYLENLTGTWQWLDRNLVLQPRAGDQDGTITVNSVSGVTLELTGGALVVTITYNSYKVYGAGGGGGNVSDSVPVSCGT